MNEGRLNERGAHKLDSKRVAALGDISSGEESNSVPSSPPAALYIFSVLVPFRFSSLRLRETEMCRVFTTAAIVFSHVSGHFFQAKSTRYREGDCNITATTASSFWGPFLPKFFRLLDPINDIALASTIG